MSFDITHCTGEKCLIAKACNRYVSGYKKFTSNVSYFAKPPFEIKNRIFKCTYFNGIKDTRK